MRRFAVCGALLALTACGSPRPAADQQALPSGPPPSASSASSTATTTLTSPVPPPPPTSPTPDSTRCTAATLSGRVEPTEAAAGNRGGKLVVTNTGPAPCTLNGYSGFQLLDASGQPVATDLRRTRDPGPSPVTLAPQSSAAANLHWTVVPTGDEPVEQPCRPEAADAAAIPPDETQPLTVPWGLGPVCGGGKIEISAFYAA